MDNTQINDELHNSTPVERKNRFIFSDDYYDQMSVDSNENEVTKSVDSDFVTDSVRQTSDFDKMVKNDYEDENRNMFNFFGHNVNVEVTDSNEVVDNVLPQLDEKEILNNTSSFSNNIFSSVQNPFTKKNEVQEEKVLIDKPIIEDNYIEFNESVASNIPVVEDDTSIVEEVQPFVEPVDIQDIEENLIDNIVDYKENVIKENSINPDNEISIDKSVDDVLPNFMEENTKVNSFDIDTGVNQELERQLIEQKQLEDEKRLSELNKISASYLPEEDNTEILYRAGGKSIVREKQNKVVDEPIINMEDTTVEEVSEIEEVPQVINIDEELNKKPMSIQDAIEDILDIPNLDEMVVPIDLSKNPGFEYTPDLVEEDEVSEDTITTVYDSEKDNFDYDQNFENVEVIKSDLLDELREKATKEGKISILARYGEDFCSKDYITNPAIGRADEIKQLILILLTPEKSGILIGKPGIGKTSIVEGLAYQLQRNNVPDALKGYRIVSVKTASLLGSLPNGETRLQTLVDELKELDKIILFVDEIHMLIGATNDSALDFANMFKESLGRGSIKVIGATTTEEYERYILRDKAFVRRFQKVEVQEPDRSHTIKILMGTLPKIEKSTGAKLKYTEYVKTEIMAFIVDITTEYKRIYGIGSRYPDICLTLLAQAFSQAVFANRKEVTIIDIRKAIENSKNIYPDVIRKELINFDEKFKAVIKEELQ